MKSLRIICEEPNESLSRCKIIHYMLDKLTMPIIHSYKLRTRAPFCQQYIYLITDLSRVKLLLPNNNVRVRQFSFKGRRLESTSLMFCRRVCLSCVKFWQWRRKCLVVSVSLPQSQIGFNESQKF